jgi:hypothetical protein
MESFKESLCALILAFSCIAYGCGSEKGSPTSEKKASSNKAQVVEVLPLTHSDGVREPGSAPQVASDPDLMEVIPPRRPGEPGVTLGEIKALRAAQSEQQVDPQLREVIPPRRPGEPGVTMREIKALRAAQSEQQADPQLREVIPPPRPGEPGVTLREIKALRTAQSGQQVDPQLREVIPPPRPGGRGVTVGEINASGGAGQR